MDNLDEEVKTFFLNAKRMKIEQRDNEFQRLKQVRVDFDRLRSNLGSRVCLIA